MKFNVLFCLIITGMLISCSSTRNYAHENGVEILELNNYYDTLILEGRKWSDDAYLYSVDFAIGERRPWALSAGFYSSTKTQESLVVIIDPHMQISRQVIDHKREIPRGDPITHVNWKIGSQDALQRLLTENAKAIASIDNLCGSLRLGRVLNLATHPLVWRLTYYECATPDAYYAYLNPLTGEIIEP